ncbi:MAG: polysaccharide biosynthesis C-terminal domain-containing protein [Armatimonadetes bacterium]|nr:polysaccharide biosynthesis C-terminal domain-containing protein [Armatimonadota bacterium]
MTPAESGSAETPAETKGRHGFGLVALALMGVHLLARFGGIIQKMVLAHFFGTSSMGDVAAAVEKVFQSIYYIPEELLTHSLLPVFNKVRRGDEQAGPDEREAWTLASQVGTLQALILVLVTIVGMSCTRWFCGVILELPTPGEGNYAAELAKFNITVYVVRIAFIGLFCTSMGSLTYVLLNAYKRFVSPAMGDVAQKLGIVVGIVIMSVGFGSQDPIGYALGFILGGVFKWLTHLIALGPKLRMARPGINLRCPHLRELGLLMLPLLAGSVIGKVRDLAEFGIAWRASQLIEGTAASLDFARKTVWLPINILPYALGIALFPFLADWALRKQKDKVTDAFLSASRNMIFVFAPITLFFLLLGSEIITVVYKSGKFGNASVDLVTRAFDVYAVAMIFYALEIIALQVFYAHRDTKTPFWIGLGASVLQVAIAWLMGLQLGLGNVGIAMGFAIAKTVKVVLMWHKLRPRLTSFNWPSLSRMALKTVASCAVMAVAILACRFGAHAVHLDLTNRKLALAFVAGTGAASFGAYLVTAALFKIDELEPLMAKVRGKLRRG